MNDVERNVRASGAMKFNLGISACWFMFILMGFVPEEWWPEDAVPLWLQITVFTVMSILFGVSWYLGGKWQNRAIRDAEETWEIAVTAENELDRRDKANAVQDAPPGAPIWGTDE
jgi:hypothetical protein